MDERTIEVITAIAESVKRKPHSIGAMSTSEGLAAALVLNKPKLLGNRTMLEAVDRLGGEWFECALEAQRRMNF